MDKFHTKNNDMARLSCYSCSHFVRHYKKQNEEIVPLDGGHCSRYKTVMFRKAFYTACHSYLIKGNGEERVVMSN